MRDLVAPPITDWTSDYQQRRFFSDEMMTRLDLVLSAAARDVRFSMWTASAEFRRARNTIMDSRRWADAKPERPRIRVSGRQRSRRPGHRRVKTTSRTADSPSGEPEPPGAASSSQPDGGAL